jgi:hypothetical protein
MDNMRTREEVDEQITWLEKRQKIIIKSLGIDYSIDPEWIANQHYIYALMWAKGFVSGYRF